MDLDRYPRVALAHLPTPFEPLARLEAALAAERGAAPRLFVKRDDCTGLALGGNKTRKLEFLLAEALAEGADTVIATGGVQSNHVRQTAAGAAKLGLAAELVLTRNVPREVDDYARTGNPLLDRLLGARLHVHPRGTDRTAALAALAEALRAQGRRPYTIPLGGSNEVGVRGYLACAAELAAQAEAACGGLDAVVLASSSGGTQAGLTAGLAALGAETQVLGIDVNGDAEALAAEVRRLTAAAARQVDRDPEAAAARVEVIAGYAGDGYGEPTPAMAAAVARLARLEGLLLDPVYSGKAMAGLLGLIEAGSLAAGARVAFLHGGGTPALFAYRSVFEALEGPA